MKLNWLRTGALAAFLGVLLGAFGAHALEQRLSVEQKEWWQIATQYHLIHALALTVVGCLPSTGRARSIAGGAFVVGLFFFSGSLYAMALGAPRWLGALTPLGGTAFMIGWIALACSHRPQ